MYDHGSSVAYSELDRERSVGFIVYSCVHVYRCILDHDGSYLTSVQFVAVPGHFTYCIVHRISYHCVHGVRQYIQLCFFRTNVVVDHQPAIVGGPASHHGRWIHCPNGSCERNISRISPRRDEIT